MNRMIFEFPRIETLEGVTRTPYNQYESVILPLKAYLETNGVRFETGRTVTDIDFAPGEALTATALHFCGRLRGRSARRRRMYHDECLYDGFRYIGQPACTGSGTGTKASFR